MLPKIRVWLRACLTNLNSDFAVMLLPFEKYALVNKIVNDFTRTESRTHLQKQQATPKSSTKYRKLNTCKKNCNLYKVSILQHNPIPSNLTYVQIEFFRAVTVIIEASVRVFTRNFVFWNFFRVFRVFLIFSVFFSHRKNTWFLYYFKQNLTHLELNFSIF